MADFTADACLARADDLARLADRSERYDLILLYDDLAQEWRRLAGLIAASELACNQHGSAGPKCASRRRHLLFRLG